MDLDGRLDELESQLQSFACRTSSIIADLVLIALATDLLETGRAVATSCRSELPHKAYANARLVFETAQNLLVLTTHENYSFAGALAWVYFESKDAPWRSAVARGKSDADEPTEEQWLSARVQQMVLACDSIADGSGRLLEEALVLIRRDRKKKPDNWLHEKMSQRHHRSYQLLAARTGGALPADTAGLNDKIYQALCRETHVRPRLDSFGLIHNKVDNTVTLDILPRNLAQARSAIINGTELAVSEAVVALKWQRGDAV